MKYESAGLQDVRELERFIKLIQAERVTSYLEIGSKHGGSLWRIANALPDGSRVVSVDLPHGDRSFKVSQPNLEGCIKHLAKRGYVTSLLIGDSTDPVIIEQVTNWAPFDLCFIDANHTEEFVRRDWHNYGPLARIVAFHDIRWEKRPEPSKKMPIDVPKVWNEIKGAYRYKEICECPRDNGIGVLWRT